MDYREVLKAQTVLDRKYRIDRVIGAGGFGITYQAFDIGLAAPVAIKEYYPAQFGMRDSSLSVRPRTDGDRPLFERLRASFLREARTLAQFDHPAIVRVLSVFETHGTAYMVMRFESGASLKVWLKELGRAPTQRELDRLLGPLLDAIELMHMADFLHRDIAPDNIIVRSDGTPVLLDFGASRRVVTDMSGTLTGVVKQGYSPQEQYSSDTRSQGPWTDIYSLGATLYLAVTGRVPTEATARMLEDGMMPAAEGARGDYRDAFLAAIDAAMRLRPRERPQSVAEWRAMLFDGADTGWYADDGDAFLGGTTGPGAMRVPASSPRTGPGGRSHPRGQSAPRASAPRDAYARFGDRTGPRSGSHPQRPPFDQDVSGGSTPNISPLPPSMATRATDFALSTRGAIVLGVGAMLLGGSMLLAFESTDRPVGPPRQQEDARKTAEAEVRRQEAARQAELARQQEEARRKAAEAEVRRQEAARQAELARQQEEARRKAAEVEARRQEAARQAELARQREQARKAAEAEARRQEAARQAELARQQEEARKAAEAEARRQEAARQAELARQQEEARKAAEAEARRQEAARQAELARQREAAAQQQRVASAAAAAAGEVARREREANAARPAGQGTASTPSASILFADPAREPGTFVMRLAMTGNGVLAGGTNGRLRLWTSEGNALIAFPAAGDASITDLSVSDDGTHAVSGALDGTIRIWDVRKRATLHTLGGDGSPVVAVKYRSETRVVAIFASGKWEIVHPGSGDVLMSGTKSDVAGVTAAQFADEGKIVFAALTDGSDGNVIEGWVPSDGGVTRVAARLVGHTGRVNALAASPNGELVASAGDDGTVRLWQVDGARERGRLETSSGAIVRALAFSATGALVAGAGADGTVDVWQTSDGKLVASYRGTEDGLQAAVFGSDGAAVVAAGVDGAIRQWPLPAGFIIKPPAKEARPEPVVAVVPKPRIERPSRDEKPEQRRPKARREEREEKPERRRVRERRERHEAPVRRAPSGGGGGGGGGVIRVPTF